MFRPELSSSTSCSSPTSPPPSISKRASIPPETTLLSPAEKSSLPFERFVSFPSDSTQSTLVTGNLSKSATKSAESCSAEMQPSNASVSVCFDKLSLSPEAAAAATQSNLQNSGRRGSVGISALTARAEASKRTPDASAIASRRGSGGSDEKKVESRRGSGAAEERRCTTEAQAAIRRGSGPAGHAPTANATSNKKGSDQTKSGGEKIIEKKNAGGGQLTLDKSKSAEKGSSAQKKEAAIYSDSSEPPTKKVIIFNFYLCCCAIFDLNL